jgi:hypothetical protein
MLAIGAASKKRLATEGAVRCLLLCLLLQNTNNHYLIKKNTIYMYSV